MTTDDKGRIITCDQYGGLYRLTVIGDFKVEPLNIPLVGAHGVLYAFDSLYIMVNERTDASPSHNGRDIVQLRGSVKIPINKGRFDAKEQEENLKIEALELQKENAVSRFNAMIERTYASHEAVRLQIDFYEKQMDITKAAIRLLETEYSVKGTRFDELLQLEKDLINYELKILKAVVDSHLAKAELEKFIF